MMNRKNKIYIIFSLFALVYADTDSDVTVLSSGSIPFCASWTSTTPQALGMGSVDIDTYDADHIEFESIIEVSDFDANYAFNVTATKTGWTTLPDGYSNTYGAKKSDGSDSDLLIKVDDINTGIVPHDTSPPASSGGLAVANSYNTYQPATTGGAVILSAGSTSAGSAHGVENAQFNIDAKILLDWDTDIPGLYVVSLTITVATQ